LWRASSAAAVNAASGSFSTSMCSWCSDVAPSGTTGDDLPEALELRESSVSIVTHPSLDSQRSCSLAEFDLDELDEFRALELEDGERSGPISGLPQLAPPSQ